MIDRRFQLSHINRLHWKPRPFHRLSPAVFVLGDFVKNYIKNIFFQFCNMKRNQCMLTLVNVK